MLTYLINVTDDLLAVLVITGVIFAFIGHYSGEKGKLIVDISLAAGALAAAARAYITNTRRIAGGWRVGAYGYGCALAVFALLTIALIIFGRGYFRRAAEGRKGGTGDIVISLLTGLLIMTYFFGALPNVMVYPFKFDTGGNGLLSTDFMFRLGGYLLGLLVSFLSLLSAYRISSLIAKKGFGGLLTASFCALNIIYAVYNFARLMLVLTPRKIIDSIPLFNFAAFSNNHAHWYTYAGFIVLFVMAAVIFARGSADREKYVNNAQKRKIRAQWRSGRRYSVLMCVCFVTAILCATWFVELNTVVIREAPVEEPEIIAGDSGEDEELRVPLELVSDGHLHRFGYTTADGYPARFIVILKQANTTNYGVGLDACEICGEAGYYEDNDGRVVCKKCGVVMNTTTIGMKGGCNPIIIDYDIDESYITVPVAEMIKNEKYFKK